MLLQYFLLFLGLSHAAILRSKDLQMDITELLTLKDLVKTQLVDKKWIDVEKVFERITPNAGLFENKQKNEIVFETKKNSWTQIEIVKNLKVCRNLQNLIEERNWDEVFLELISKDMLPLADEFCEALAYIVNGKAVHALMECRVCHTHLLEILLKRSETNPDAKNAFGQTPLHTVADGWNEVDAPIDFVEILLKHGAEIDPTDNDLMTPLMIAIESSNICVVRTLLAYGANPNLRDKHNQTCLHLATHDGRTQNAYGVDEILNDSVKHKPDVDAADNEMRTPLMNASKNGNEVSVRFLLLHGASPNLRDKYGKTALHYAAENSYYTANLGPYIPEFDTIDRYIDVIEILLEFKADPNATDNQLQTPQWNKARMASIRNNARDKWLKQKLKQIKRKRKKLFPKQNLEIMSED